MSAHAANNVTDSPAKDLAHTPLELAFECFMLGDHPVSRRDIAHTVATDGLAFLGYEERWGESDTRFFLHQLGNLEQRLTGVDCQSYVAGMAQYLDEPEKLKSFVTSFTRALLSRWNII